MDKLDVAHIYTAINGYEGINLAIENNPDVIFLDLMMPELSGAITLKLLKSLSITKDIPVIIITANSDFESLGTVLALGATEFVAKPFTYATIQKKLQAVIENRPAARDIDSRVIDALDFGNDDLEFLNAFSNGIESSLTEDEDDTQKPRINRFQSKYDNITVKYKANTEDEIKKILDS